jgi:hypothetical protein
MQDEIVVLYAKRGIKVQAKDFYIPEIRPIALCLEKVHCDMLVWSHRMATETLNRILRRQKLNSVQDLFQFDVPDLHEISKLLPKEESHFICDFWVRYHAIIKHFIPDAKVSCYYLPCGKKAGVNYKGFAWYEEEQKS